MQTADRTSTTTALLAGTVLSAVRAVAVAAKNGWRAWRNRREMTNLLEFDDHMLADIGLVRGDVTSAMASPFGIDPTTRLRLFAVERRAGQKAQARERLEELKRYEAGARGVPAE